MKLLAANINLCAVKLNIVTDKPKQHQGEVGYLGRQLFMLNNHKTQKFGVF